MTGWSPDPYRDGPSDPYAGRPAVVPTAGPAPYLPYGAPVPLYQPYPNPGSWELARYAPRQAVPGPVVAATVLGYVLALAELVAGFFALVGASVLSALQSVPDADPVSGVPFTIEGLACWASAVLLVVGGIVVTLHHSVGRILLLVGAGVAVAISVFWIVRFPIGPIVFWAALFAAPAVVASVLVLQPRVGAWLARAVPSTPQGPLPFPTDAYGRPFGT